MSASTDSASARDASALAEFDRLLQKPPSERVAMLEQIARECPALHGRLIRLLAASERGESSCDLLRPLLDLDVDAARVADEMHRGATLGGYRLLRELGRGGMSVVWLAERIDGLIRRPVALKIPLRTLESNVDRERFARERDVLSTLTHPGIARLFDAGIAQSGQPFLVLEFVEGVPLTTACDDAALGIRERVRLFLQVLDAVDQAHKQLIVHRDLKPSNILVDADRRVRLLDFGIAKMLDGSAAAYSNEPLTLAGGCALTPRYAAPEQLEGGIISTATDIYALGVVLYELLTGVSPYGAEPASVSQWLRAVLETEPRRPSIASEAAPDVRRGSMDNLDGDLDNVVLKALRKAPGERYGSVDRFRDDLQAWLDHRPISARAPTLFHRGRLFVRRNLGASITSGVGIALALGLGAVAVVQFVRTQEERQRADVMRDFMFDLVDDSERDETQGFAEPTGRQMVAAAEDRARSRFAAQPRLRGELLAELGRMQGKLGEDEKSFSVLQEAVTDLTASAQPGEAALNKARTYLADAHMGRGDAASAANLSEAVLARCTDGLGCAKARYYASSILGRVALQRGDVSLALEHMRKGVAESTSGFGAHDPEVALALLAYAITARQAGQLDLSKASLEKAETISQGVRMRLSDRIALQRIGAVLSMDLGEYESARIRLGNALAVSVKDADRAELSRILATVLVLNGQAQAARDAAETSVRLSPPDSVQLLLARQVHARSQLLLGAPADAVAEMVAVIDGLKRAGYAGRTMELMRARRFHAEAYIRNGQLDLGRALLQELAREQADVQQGQEVEYAQTLDLLGSVMRQSGGASEALIIHRSARTMLAARLPSDHPYLLRNALYAGAAELALHPTAEWRQEMTRLGGIYAARFPQGSFWSQVVQEAFTTTRCQRTDGPFCPLFL